jgi:uncharacterized NAD-dependent epimerase/dehydratase family protein
VFVLCHEPGRTHLLGYPDYPTPGLEQAIELHCKMGSLTNPAIRCGGISFNTSALTSERALAVMEETSSRLRLPVADPMQRGEAFERLVMACQQG